MTCKKITTIATVALLSMATIAIAQNDSHTLGTVKSGFTAGITKVRSMTTFAPTFTYASASYGTGGVALRNRSQGYIQVSGVNGPTQAAFLYWAVLLNNPTPQQLKKASVLQLQREFPKGAGTATVVEQGTLLAIGGDPCWGSSGAWVYRAAVPTSVATGNGSYRVIIPTPAVGLSDGEDPWDGNVVFPLWEGASLVIIGTGSASVGVFDAQAGTTFLSTLSNSYTLPAAITGSNFVLLDNIGYDGQIGSSRTAEFSNETTNVTGEPSGTSVNVAGPGGEVSDSDWDGSSGWPLPQLWDNTGHDISNAFAAGDTSATVTYTPFGDCLGTVAAVVSVQ